MNGIIGQLYSLCERVFKATTNIGDPIIAKVDITRQEGFVFAPKSYRELMSELVGAYAQER